MSDSKAKPNWGEFHVIDPQWFAADGIDLTLDADPVAFEEFIKKNVHRYSGCQRID